MKILTVIGNRPQFIKAAAVSPPLRAEHEEYLVHTGQHYDDQLSAVFFAELGLPAPDEQLGIGGGSQTSQTSRMLAALEPILTAPAPDAVLVYGDTNSTLAGALAGAQVRVPVVHVEAGMRSFDRSMPEELNRVLVDHASSLLLCSTEVAMANLRARGGRRRERARRRRDGGRGGGRPAPSSRARGAGSSSAGLPRAGTCSSPLTGRATSTTRTGWRDWWSCCARCRSLPFCRCIPAPRRA